MTNIDRMSHSSLFTFSKWLNAADGYAATWGPLGFMAEGIEQPPFLKIATTCWPSKWRRNLLRACPVRTLRRWQTTGALRPTVVSGWHTHAGLTPVKLLAARDLTAQRAKCP